MACGDNCLLAHDLFNKLTTIIGQCEILEDKALDPECLNRLQKIRQTARAMADEISTHQCRISDLLRKA